MGDLTRNFSRKEFTCICGCGFDTIDFQLIMCLQDSCDYFAEQFPGKRIMAIITSGNRCLRHNTKLRDEFKRTKGLHGANASLNSQHIYGRAADFKLYIVDEQKNKVQIEPEKVAEYFESYHEKCGVGRYSNRVHVDTRTNGPARWHG